MNEFSAEVTQRMDMAPSDTGAFTRAYLEMGAVMIDNPDMVTLLKSAMAGMVPWLGIRTECGCLADHPEFTAVSNCV